MMKSLSRWLAAVLLPVVVLSCTTPGPDVAGSAEAMESIALPAVIGDSADALMRDALAARFVAGEPVPAEVRAAQGRRLVVLIHIGQNGFARLSILGDPVARIVFAGSGDDAALDAFATLLASRGLGAAGDWLHEQRTRAAANPTADFTEQTLLPGGLAIAYKREVPGNDPNSAVVSVVLGS